jgi:outer membrane receptor protein involved in Fe transport
MLFTSHKGTMNLKALTLVCFMVVMIAGNLPAQQETGSIKGTIKDQSGAVIPGATVTIKNVGTNAVRTTITGADGSFVSTNLLPATYSVTAAMTGFNTGTKQVILSVGGVATADMSLTVGANPTTIVVSEQAVQVDTETQTMSSVVTTKQISDLPTLTRNPYDLVATASNINPVDPRDVVNGVSRGLNFNINGMRSASTNILLDGADNNDSFTAALGQPVPLDSVQEFSVVTSSFTAEYGRASGGVVNVATKSGSNEFHGSAYEFNRVSRLSSNSFDNNANGIPKSVFTRNQFGFSVGGPVVKDKLFFFTNTEWFRVRSAATEQALVPTSQLISAAAPVTQQFFSTFGQLKLSPNGTIYTKDQIPGLCAAGGLCASLPGSTPMFGTVNYPVPTDAGGGNPQNTYQSVARVDYMVNSKLTLYGRYAVDHEDQFAGTNAFSPFAGYDSGISNFNQNALFSATYTVSPRMVSQSKIVYSRLTQLQPLGTAPVSPSLYLASPNVASTINGIDVALPGYFPFNPAVTIPFGGPQNLGQFYEDFSWVKGAHTFRFGGQYLYIRDNRAFGAYENAIEILGNNLNQGIENFLSGNLTTFEAAVDPQGKFPGQTLTLPVGAPNFTRSNRYNDFAFYGQDTWRAMPRLTFNLGLRWEYYGVQHNKNPFLDSNFYLGSGATFDQQVANGSVLLAPNSPIGNLWQKDEDNFAPRIGAAWDVFGNGRTSLRGGYGISYERNFGNVTFNVIQNPPNYAVISLSPADVGGNLPVSVDNAGPLAGSSGTKVLPRTSLRAVDPNMQTAYAQIWSAVLEQQIVPNTVLSVGYSGSHGHGLYTINRLNLVGSSDVLLGVGGPSDRLNSQYSTINFRTDDGVSNYNAGILELRSQNPFHSGAQFTLNYTYSHSLDNVSDTFSGLGGDVNLGLLDYHNPRLDYGNSEFDIRHRVSLSGIWELPYGKNWNGAFKQVLGGWTIAPLFRAHTGAPFTIFDCSNQGPSGLCSRMLLVNPNQPTTGASNPAPVAGIPNNFQFLDLSSQLSGVGTVANPITGTTDFGPFPVNMTARNAFRQPGVWFADLGVYKSFKLKREGTSLQFRTEMYNIFNHSNLYALIGSSADISGTTYIPADRGATGLAAERRNIQFALKFNF